MGERSLMSMDNLVPAATGVNTVWLAVLSYWVSARNSELTVRVSKLEAENKILKKKLLIDGKRRDNEIRDIVETLKEHDRRISRAPRDKTDRDATRRRVPEQTHNPKPVKIRDVEISESDSRSEADSEVDDEDLSGLYDVPRRRR